LPAGGRPEAFRLLWKSSLEKLKEKPFKFEDAGHVVYRALAWRRLGLLGKSKGAQQLKAVEEDALEGIDLKAWLAEGLSLPGGVTIARVSKKAIGEGLGFLSMCFKIGLTYEGPSELAIKGLPSSVILKMPSRYEESFDLIAEETDCYRREHDFYIQVAPALAGTAMRVPKLYSSEVVPNSGVRLLMEDLGGCGYSVNQLDGLSAAEVAPFVQMAAEMHAAFWPLTGRSGIPECVVRAADERSFIARWPKCFVARYDEFLRSEGLAKFDIGIEKSVVLDIAAKIHGNADKILDRVSRIAPQTVIHSDYRADNFIVGSPDGESCVLDWQLLSTGPGVYDLGDCVVKSMTVENGAKHLDHLLGLYHDTLVRAGVVGYSQEEMWTDFKFSILNHLTLVFAISLDGIGADGELVADWSCFNLCRVMFRRLVRVVLDRDCLSVLDQKGG